MAEEAAAMRTRREESRRKQLNLSIVKARRAAQAEAKAKAQAEKAARQAKIDALPKALSAATCGQPGPKGAKARSHCLERLRLGSPMLPFEHEVKWLELRDYYAKHCKTIYGVGSDGATGLELLEKIKSVLKKLREHAPGGQSRRVAGPCTPVHRGN
jgi:hypothetical protein